MALAAVGFMKDKPCGLGGFRLTDELAVVFARFGVDGLFKLGLNVLILVVR